MDTSDATPAKRARASNFSPNEKSHLINIISKYKSIIENKETDKNTNFEKNSAWDKVTAEFNATSPTKVFRSKDSIKRFYENKKKELRKRVADQKMEQKKTGGGLPPPECNDPFNDVLLSITNKKTVYGLETPYGGDISSSDEAPEESQIDPWSESRTEPQTKPYNNNEIEIVYEIDNGNDHDIEQDVLSPLVAHNTWTNYKPTNIENSVYSSLRTSESQKENNGLDTNGNGTWRKYKATDLQKTKTSALRTESQKGNGLAVKYVAKDQPGTSAENNIERNPLHQVIDKKNESDTPKARRRSTPALNRRRPNIQVKALTSSDVGEKYNQLLDMRLQIADYTKDRLIQEKTQADEKHQKEMDLLDLQISLEKERIKRITRTEY